jgi:hypothetical protein
VIYIYDYENEIEGPSYENEKKKYAYLNFPSKMFSE